MCICKYITSADDADGWKHYKQKEIDRVWFDVPLNTLQVVLETIFPANHLTGVKTQSPQQITWLVLVNKIKQQPNYNTNNLRHVTTKLFMQN